MAAPILVAVSASDLGVRRICGGSHDNTIQSDTRSLGSCDVLAVCLRSWIQFQPNLVTFLLPALLSAAFSSLNDGNTKDYPTANHAPHSLSLSNSQGRIQYFKKKIPPIAFDFWPKKGLDESRMDRHELPTHESREMGLENHWYISFFISNASQPKRNDILVEL